MIQITQSYLTNSPCYKTKRNIKVSGLMLHSVGCPQPNAQVFIKNWNTSSCKVGVHAFADTTGVFETLPCREIPGIAHRAWHCGSGSKGSFNNSHILIILKISPLKNKTITYIKIQFYLIITNSYRYSPTVNNASLYFTINYSYFFTCL